MEEKETYMDDPIHPYIQLRHKIRQAGRQFRKNDDNSTSLFHPSSGFIYAYEMAKVEEALDAYENELPTEYLAVDDRVTMETKLLNQAQVILETSKSMDIRDFARQVMAYLVIHEGKMAEQNIVPSLFLLKTDPSIKNENDTLD